MVKNMASDDDYQSIWTVVERLIKARVRADKDQFSSGYAGAVGLLNVYLVEAIADLSQAKRREWLDKLERLCREIEQETIMKRLSQEETHE